MSNSLSAIFLEHHRDELFHFLNRRVGCPETARDLLQDLFLRLANHSGGEPIQNPRAYLYRIAANLATDHVRMNERRAKREDADTELKRIVDPAAAVDELVAVQLRMEHLKAVIAELPPRCREVFILLKIKQYTYEEVQEELGISPAMVFKHMKKALEHCRQRLQSEPD